MKYTKKTINVATRGGKKAIPAFIAPNTGLAYHGYLNQDDTLSNKLYVVTHVHTGLSLLIVSKVSDAREAIDALVNNSKGLIEWTAENPLANISTKEYQTIKDMIRGIQACK